MTDIASNLSDVRHIIDDAAAQSGRDPGQIQLLAVSKTQPAAAIEQAHGAGQKDFGENYLQEALAKQAELSHLPLNWHFIGPIQSNKTRDIATHFAWVHSVDRLKIAQRLSNQKPAELPPIQICLQVNIDEDPNKAGCSAEQALSLAPEIAKMPGLTLRGLMTIPTAGHNGKPFADLARLMHRINTEHGLRLDTLSMGMSGDMEAAIAAGATMVRVGTAIFGARR